MKASKYNICIPYKEGYAIFNGVTKRFFLVSSHKLSENDVAKIKKTY